MAVSGARPQHEDSVTRSELYEQWLAKGKALQADLADARRRGVPLPGRDARTFELRRLRVLLDRSER